MGIRNTTIRGCALAALIGGGMAAAVASPDRDERLGVYRGAGCEGRPRVDAFGLWLGRTPGWVVDFLAEADWDDIRNSAQWILRCWRGVPHQLSLAVPMLPSDGSATLRAGAAGTFDERFRELARMLVTEGRGTAVLRLGWEFNGEWMTWSAARDPAAFVAYWRRIVWVMRSVPGAGFRFEWAPTLGPQAIAPDRVYPGNDVVDVIGISAYNQSWTVPSSDAEGRWQELEAGEYGLAWHQRFAAEHGKLRSFPEWGTGRRPEGTGGGDDPLYVARMAELLSERDVLYHAYFEFAAPDMDARLSDGTQPLAAGEFRRRFGTAAPRQ